VSGLLWLALKGLRRNPRRTATTACALAAAAAGGLLFYGFTRNTYWGLSESFARAGNGHIQIAAADWFDSPDPETHRVPAQTLRDLQAALVAEADLAALLAGQTVRRHITGMLVNGERSGVFLGVGTDPAMEGVLSPLVKPVSGRALVEAPADAVLLGEPLGQRLGVSPGDLVTLLVATDQGMTNAMDLEVAGLTRTGAAELDRTLATLPLITTLDLVVGESADLLVVALGETEQTDDALAVVKRVLERPEYSGLAARPWYQQARYYIAVRALYDRIFGIFQMLMVLVTVLSMSHAIAAVVAERRSEIALLRVIGLRQRRVVTLFVVEGAILGLLGALGGAGLASVVAVIVEAAGGIPMPPPPGFTVGYAALFHFDALGYAVVLPLTVAAAMIASAVPAWRASRGALSRALMGAIALLVVLPAQATGPAEATGPVEASGAGEGAALLAAADAARATPPGQICALDVVITDAGGTVGWRVDVAGDRALARSTTLPAARAQAVLRDGDETWFQTAAMRGPMKVRPGMRVLGQVAVADLLAPRLAETWTPTAVQPGDPTTVAVTGEGGAAELDFGPAGALVAGRFFAPSGRLLRSASWRAVESGGFQVEIVGAGGKRSVVEIGAPVCAPGAWEFEAASLSALLGELASEPSGDR